MTSLIRGVTVRQSGCIRQGVTIDGIDVVVVALTMEDVDVCRETTVWAVEQYGASVLTRAGHPPIEGDQPIAAPIILMDRLLGYVELAP